MKDTHRSIRSAMFFGYQRVLLLPLSNTLSPRRLIAGRLDTRGLRQHLAQKGFGIALYGAMQSAVQLSYFRGVNIHHCLPGAPGQVLRSETGKRVVHAGPDDQQKVAVLNSEVRASRR